MTIIISYNYLWDMKQQLHVPMLNYTKYSFRDKVPGFRVTFVRSFYTAQTRATNNYTENKSISSRCWMNHEQKLRPTFFSGELLCCRSLRWFAAGRTLELFSFFEYVLLFSGPCILPCCRADSWTCGESFLLSPLYNCALYST